MYQTAHPLEASPEFYAGYQQAAQDFERKYKHQSVPIDEAQLNLIFVRVVYATEQSDSWKTGYLAGFFAALYSMLCEWSVSYAWTLGECAHDLIYAVESVRSAP